MTSDISVYMNMNITFIEVLMITAFMDSDTNKVTCFTMLGTFTLIVSTTDLTLVVHLIAIYPLTPMWPPTEGKATRTTAFITSGGK